MSKNNGESQKSSSKKAPSETTGQDRNSVPKVKCSTCCTRASSKWKRKMEGATRGIRSPSVESSASYSSQFSDETLDISTRSTGEGRRRKQPHPQKCLAKDDPSFRGANIYMRPVLENMESKLETKVTFQGIPEEMLMSFKDLEVQPKDVAPKEKPEKLLDVKGQLDKAGEVCSAPSLEVATSDNPGSSKEVATGGNDNSASPERSVPAVDQ